MTVKRAASPGDAEDPSSERQDPSSKEESNIKDRKDEGGFTVKWGSSGLCGGWVEGGGAMIYPNMCCSRLLLATRR